MDGRPLSISPAIVAPDQPAARHGLCKAEASRAWLRIALLSFGATAGLDLAPTGRLPPAPRYSRALACDIAVICLIACLSSELRAVNNSVQIDFRQSGTGVAPADFDFWVTDGGAPGQWAVVRDRAGTPSEAVIEQFNQDKTKERFALAIYKLLVLKNFDLTVRIKAVDGRLDQMAGVSLRLVSPEKYYAVGVDTVAGEVVFFRVLRGEVQRLESVEAEVYPSQWHTLGVAAERNCFVVSLDGNWLFTVFDDPLTDAGRIALLTKADTIAQFDHIEITPRPWQETR